jgi:hypothetical protein
MMLTLYTYKACGNNDCTVHNRTRVWLVNIVYITKYFDDTRMDKIMLFTGIFEGRVIKITWNIISVCIQHTPVVLERIQYEKFRDYWHIVAINFPVSRAQLFQHQFFFYPYAAVTSIPEQYKHPVKPATLCTAVLAFRSLKSLSHLSRRVIIVETDVMSRCVCRSRTAGYRGNQIFHYKRRRRRLLLLLLLLLLLWRFILDPNVRTLYTYTRKYQKCFNST